LAKRGGRVYGVTANAEPTRELEKIAALGACRTAGKMRQTMETNRPVLSVVILAALLLPGNVQAFSSSLPCCPASLHLPNRGLIVGGQNGTWFKGGQNPRLFKVNLTNSETARLPTFRSQGTIWSGSTNGTNWLISGWGSDQYGANPPIILYDSSFSIIYRSSMPNANSSWYGGDIFASSYGRHEWLMSGLGSGHIDGMNGNHMSLASFDGSNFTDLSLMVPDNQLGILYANYWNGSLWMVGGGFRFKGFLFTFNGTTIHDLTDQLSQSVPVLGPVTSLAWNGTDWLIGGYQSLAIYDGHRFTAMSEVLGSAVGKQFHAVNAIGWDKHDNMWLLAGGFAKADLRASVGWIAALSSNGKARNLSSLISPYLKSASSSSILTASFDDGLWVLGGYANKGKGTTPILLAISFPTTTVTDFSRAVEDTTYVIWVGLGPSSQIPQQIQSRCEPASRSQSLKGCVRYDTGKTTNSDTDAWYSWISKDSNLQYRRVSGATNSHQVLWTKGNGSSFE
jgi:hypothetical protein